MDNGSALLIIGQELLSFINSLFKKTYNVSIYLVLIVLLYGNYVSAQSTLTIDQVEAQVVVLQNCCNKISAPVILALPLAVATIQNQLASMNLQLSTVGVLTQLGLDNQANIQTMQAQIATLQAQVAALQVPVSSIKRK